jgi:biotin carboxyl carrier protein
MKKLLKATLIIGAVALAVPLIIWAFLEGRKELERELEMEKPFKAPQRVSRGPNGDLVVKLDAEAQKRLALAVEPLAELVLSPEVTGYGRFQEDPSRSFVVRAPITGTLRRSNDRGWPGLGDKIDEGAPLGVVEPRFAPVDRVDLASRLASAQAEAESARASQAAAQAALARARTLNAENKNVADRTVEEAQARVKNDEARLKAAVAIEASLVAPAPPVTSQAGEVVEILAQPGEAVESGQALLRVTRFDALLARVALPVGESIERAKTARIVPLGRSDVLQGERVALASSADPALLGETIVFRVTAADLRPGMAFTAYLARPGDPVKGVLVPSGALVRFGGKTWVYVRSGAELFSRREVREAKPVEKGFFVAAGLAPGEPVVVVGTQMVLSEELKAQIQIEEEEK